MRTADITNIVAGLRATIGNLADRIDRHGARLRALENRTRRTVVVLTDLAVGATDVAIAWDAPYPDQGYAVIPTIICGPVALGVLSAGLKTGTRTEAGCTVQVVNTGATVIATAALDVIAVRA